MALETSLNRAGERPTCRRGGETTNPRLRELLSIRRIARRPSRTRRSDPEEPHATGRDSELVERMVGAEELFLLQGPPGTGEDDAHRRVRGAGASTSRARESSSSRRRTTPSTTPSSGSKRSRERRDSGGDWYATSPPRRRHPAAAASRTASARGSIASERGAPKRGRTTLPLSLRSNGRSLVLLWRTGERSSTRRRTYARTLLQRSSHGDDVPARASRAEAASRRAVRLGDRR